MKFWNGEIKTIGLCSPSGIIKEYEVKKGSHLLEKLGYQVKYNADIFLESDFFAGTAPQRAASLNNLLIDPGIDAVLFTRGGSGSVHLLTELEKIDSSLWQPKPLIGFSDTTTLLNYFSAKHGWITFHSHVLRSLFKAPKAEQNNWKHFFAGELTSLINEEFFSHLVIYQLGETTSQLAGGNLATIVSLIGTPWELNFDEKILFLEDVNEAPYALERMFSQLYYSGALRNISGLILGNFTYEHSNLNLTELLPCFKKFLTDAKIPVIAGFPAGHTDCNKTLPIGAKLKLKTDVSGIDLQLLPLK